MNQESIISIRDLTKKFGNLTAVDGLSFTIRKHEIFGFLGPNGAGKTTTISMICGLLPPTSGSVNYHFSQNMPPGHFRLQIGYCPQENIFYPKLTCREQLIFMAEMYGLRGKAVKDRADRLLELMGLKEKAGTLAGKLSGGMKRRLSICLALVHDPEILILDEPEAGLDPQSRLLVREVIRSFAQKKTIILTTHNMDEAERLSDRVAIIDHGRLLMLDTPENLKKTIGEGDFLELDVEGMTAGRWEKSEEVRKALAGIVDKVYFSGESLILRSLHILDAIPAINGIFSKQGLKITGMNLRENTLEDVFIHLTGRKLRS